MPDFSETGRSPFRVGRKSEVDILNEFKAKFTESFKFERKWREEKKLSEEFYDGDQWTGDELNELKRRNQPDTVINRIKPKVDSIVGLELGVPVNTKAFNRTNRDFEGAKHMTEALRFIEQTTEFDDAESRGFEEMLVSGRLWYEVFVSWDQLDAEIKTEFVSCHDMFADKHSQRDDLKDAKHVHKSKWADLEDAQEMFPKHKRALEESLFRSKSLGQTIADKMSEFKPDQFRQPGGDVSDEDFELFVDIPRKRVRIVSTWYRTPYVKKYLWVPNSGMHDVTEETATDIKKIKEASPDTQEFSEVKFKMNVITYVWNKILEHKKDIQPWDSQARFPFVMASAYRKKQEKKRGQPYGLVKQMIDPQKEVNKRRSKMLHLLNTNKMLFEQGAFEAPEKARQEWAKPDAWLSFIKEFQVNPQQNTELAQSQFLLLQESKGEIDAVGVKGEIEGQSKATSGRDFQLRHESATQSIRPLFKSLRGARRRVGLLWISHIQKFWTQEKAIRVSDDPNAAVIVLNQRVKDPVTGQPVILNAVSGKYDLIVEESPETLHLMSEQFDGLVKIEQARPGTIPIDMIIEASSVPNKQEVLERVRQQQEQQQQMLQAQLAQGQVPQQ